MQESSPETTKDPSPKYKPRGRDCLIKRRIPHDCPRSGQGRFADCPHRGRYKNGVCYPCSIGLADRNRQRRKRKDEKEDETLAEGSSDDDDNSSDDISRSSSVRSPSTNFLGDVECGAEHHMNRWQSQLELARPGLALRGMSEEDMVATGDAIKRTARDADLIKNTHKTAVSSTTKKRKLFSSGYEDGDNNVSGKNDENFTTTDKLPENVKTISRKKQKTGPVPVLRESPSVDEERDQTLTYDVHARGNPSSKFNGSASLDRENYDNGVNQNAFGSPDEIGSGPFDAHLWPGAVLKPDLSSAISDRIAFGSESSLPLVMARNLEPDESFELSKPAIYLALCAKFDRGAPTLFPIHNPRPVSGSPLNVNTNHGPDENSRNMAKSTTLSSSLDPDTHYQWAVRTATRDPVPLETVHEAALSAKRTVLVYGSLGESPVLSLSSVLNSPPNANVVRDSNEEDQNTINYSDLPPPIVAASNHQRFVRTSLGNVSLTIPPQNRTTQTINAVVTTTRHRTGSSHGMPLFFLFFTFYFLLFIFYFLLFLLFTFF